MNSLDYFFFSAYPYVAFIVFVVGVIYRYNEKGFKVSSLSAQFLESKKGFWGTVPFPLGHTDVVPRSHGCFPVSSECFGME